MKRWEGREGRDGKEVERMTERKGRTSKGKNKHAVSAPKSNILDLPWRVTEGMQIVIVNVL